MQRTPRQVLLVRKHEQKTLLHLPITQYPMELLLRLVYTFPVLAVDNEDETLGTGVVMPPQRPDLILSSDIPDVEFDVLVRHGLHVKAHYAPIRKHASRQHTRATMLSSAQTRGDVPVVIVVTVWFNLSLYRMA